MTDAESLGRRVADAFVHGRDSVKSPSVRALITEERRGATLFACVVLGQVISDNLLEIFDVEDMATTDWAIRLDDVLLEMRGEIGLTPVSRLPHEATDWLTEIGGEEGPS